MVYYRLTRFVENRNILPRRILFYRDGASEDQFEMCRTDEVEQILRAYEAVMDDHPRFLKPEDRKKAAKDYVQLTFVVVGKRHHTRFFAQNRDQTWRQGPGLNGNLLPGLLVEDIVTRPNVGDGITDFFLQSHAAIKGTARAGHYSILELNGFTMDQVQRLTHAFCYNYMLATKGVSYVGPAYYADRLCERGTHYLRGYVKNGPWDQYPPTDEQKKSKEGMRDYAVDFANEVDESNWWRPDDEDRMEKNNVDEKREPNPWHPDFDNCMFWL